MTSHRRLPAERDRAVARLRTLTRGAAVGGVVGTLLFGAVAAASYDGTTSTTTTVANSDDSAAQVAADDSTSDRTDDRRLERRGDSQLQATPAPRPRRRRRRARLDRQLVTEVASAGWRAIGTGVRVVVHDGSLEAARTAVADVLDEVDRALSRFRDDSELSRLNARSGEDVGVSPLLGDAIAAGLRAARITSGAVDPTVGRAMRLIGYDLDFRSLPQDGAPLEVRFEAVPGWQTVALAAHRRRVRPARGV
jgi:hypothetical protein